MDSPLWIEGVEGSFEEELRQAGLFTMPWLLAGQTAQWLRGTELTCPTRTGKDGLLCSLRWPRGIVGKRDSLGSGDSSVLQGTQGRGW